MALFNKQTPYEKELSSVIKKEQNFLMKRLEKKDNILNQKLAEKVPQKLQSTLNDAFYGAFWLIFEKGTGVIEKTYRKDEMERTYLVNEYADNIKQNKKTLKTFSKQATNSKTVNLLLSGASGIGMGALGIGIPDIPLFTGMIFRSIYEIALSYGFEYESEKEKYFILMLIQGAVSYGTELKKINCDVDEYMENEILPINYDKLGQIREVSAALSNELLYMKFLQGIPIVGVVGGASDAIYMKQILEYANLKYKHRFLLKRRKNI